MESVTDCPHLSIGVATPEDRKRISGLRHDIYAVELGQHAVNPAGRLSDNLDAFNHFITAKLDGVIAGFISITPPEGGRYSIDKYVAREELPIAVDAGTFEIRLLTVVKPVRGAAIAVLLMYAAYRWIESQGGTRIVAIGRREILDLYLKAGLRPLGRRVQSGAVCYELLSATLPEMQDALDRYAAMLSKLERNCRWELDFPFARPMPCYHGGRFFDAVGDEFDRLERRHDIINADVLDAWFPPSPRVVDALTHHLPWLIQTSPPTGCEGVVRAIARARRVPEASILPGAGSSDLIYLALRQWLDARSRVLILDPMYGEYAHILENIIRCRVNRFELSRHEGYTVNLATLEERIAQGRYDLVVLVNPNSPTGVHTPRAQLEAMLRGVPPRTRVWIDETYVDYVGCRESLESAAVECQNIVVCKSMSKVYALSGVRAAYLCAAPALIAALRPLSPPWAMSLPAQVAAVEALQDTAYYAARYAETHRLREDLARDLRETLFWDVVPGVANFLLAHMPTDGPGAAAFSQACADQNLFVRDVSNMGVRLGDHAIRVAVKDASTNARMLEIMTDVIHAMRGEGRKRARLQRPVRRIRDAALLA